jgi:transposase-like protein
LDRDSRTREDLSYARTSSEVSPQFEAEAVQMVIETGKPIAEVARDLDIHDGSLEFG